MALSSNIFLDGNPLRGSVPPLENPGSASGQNVMNIVDTTISSASNIHVSYLETLVHLISWSGNKILNGSGPKLFYLLNTPFSLYEMLVLNYVGQSILSHTLYNRSLTEGHKLCVNISIYRQLS